MATYDGSLKFNTKIDQSGFEKGLQKLKGLASKGLKLIGGAVTASTAALSGLATIGVKYNSEMEQYNKSFETMLGSAEAAQKSIAELKDFAAKTPFEFADLAKGQQTLLSFGMDAEKVGDTIKMLGDVSQGNKDKFDSLTLAFAQVQSAGKLTGQDLLQMVNAGFNPLQIMAEKSGKSMAQLREEMSKGEISAEDVADAFKVATSEGGLFFGAMEKQSKTFSGQLSTLKDNAMTFLGEVTTGITTSLKDTALPIVDNYMTRMREAFSKDGFDGLLSEFGNVLGDVVGKIAEFAPKMLDGGISLLKSFIDGILSNKDTIIKTVVEIATQLVQTVIPFITDNLPLFIDTGLEIVTALINGIASALPQVIQAMVDMIPKLVTAITDNLPLIIDVGITLISLLVQGLTKAIPQLLDALPTIITELLNGLLAAIPQLIEGWIRLFTSLVTALPDIINRIVEVLPQIITGIIDALLENLPLIVQAGVDLLVALVQNLPSIITTIVTAAPKIILSIVDALVSNIDKIIMTGAELLVALVENLPAIIVEIVKAVPQIITALVDAFGSFVGTMGEIGLNLVKGVWNGISDAAGWLWEKIKGFFESITDKIKDFFGIHSPSTLFRDMIGKNLMLGLAEGISADAKFAVGAAKDVAKQISNVDFRLNRPTYDDVSHIRQRLSFEDLSLAQVSAFTARMRAAINADINRMAYQAMGTNNTISNITNSNNTTSQQYYFYTPTATPYEVAQATRQAMEVH